MHNIFYVYCVVYIARLCIADHFGHAVICAVKTELMKRKSHATRQEAMDLVMRSCIKELFFALETLHKSQVLYGLV